MANPISRYVQRHVVAPERRSTLANPDNELMDALGGISTPSGQRVTVDRIVGLSPVWSVVRLVSEAVAQCPLKVYRDVDGEPQLATQHRTWKYLHDLPNAFTPAGRFWASATVHYLLWGQAFVWKRRDLFGNVEELYLLDPARVTVKFDAGTRTKTFEYETGNAGQPKRTFTLDDITHIMGMSLDGGVTGTSVVACRAALGTAIARDEFEGAFYRRGAVLAGVLQHPGNPSDSALKNLADSFKTLYGGSGRAHGTPVLEEGIEFKPAGSPLKDLMFVESQQLTRTDVAVMFGVPPAMIGGSTGDSLTYATVEGNQIQFATQAVAPVTTAIQQALSWDPGILPQNIFTAKFDLDGLMRGDAASRGNFYKTLSEVKAITPNEIRAFEDMPKIEGGDESPAKKQPIPPALTGTIPGNGAGNGQVNGNGAQPEEQTADV